jgi:hypothetical protein
MRLTALLLATITTLAVVAPAWATAPPHPIHECHTPTPR